MSTLIRDADRRDVAVLDAGPRMSRVEAPHAPGSPWLIERGTFIRATRHIDLPRYDEGLREMLRIERAVLHARAKREEATRIANEAEHVLADGERTLAQARAHLHATRRDYNDLAGDLSRAAAARVSGVPAQVRLARAASDAIEERLTSLERRSNAVTAAAPGVANQGEANNAKIDDDLARSRLSHPTGPGNMGIAQ